MESEVSTIHTKGALLTFYAGNDAFYQAFNTELSTEKDVSTRRRKGLIFMAQKEIDLVSADIIRLLQALGDELEQKGFQEPIRILLIGGVFMLLEVGNRTTTHDIDCVLLDLTDMSDADAPKETKHFLKAVRAVADRMNVPRAWMNDDAAMFVRDMIHAGPLHHWARYNKLDVYLPSKEYILANKLLSFREKDKPDVQALCAQLEIFTQEKAQAILDQYAPRAWQEENMVEIALWQLFPDG